MEAGERGSRFDAGVRRGASAFVPFEQGYDRSLRLAGQTRADLWNTAKTCYDPCPVGYKVPDRDTWDDFADEQDRYVDGTSEWDGEKYGMTYIFGDLRDWYPTSGYRNRDKGNLAGLATTRTGHYWSNYRSGNTISCFYISKKLSTGKLLQPQSSSKSDAAYGYNVRCCRE